MNYAKEKNMKRLSLLSRSFVIVITVLLLATVPVFAGSTTKTLSTNFTVVNLSTTNNAAVTALYYKDDGSTWTADPDKTNFNVPMNYGQFVARQYSDGTLTSGKGSVVLSSTEPLAAVVQIQARNQTPTMGAYTGYTSGSNKFYVPLVMRNANSASGIANTQIMIQNIMNEDINATVDFVPSPGTAFPIYTKQFTGADNIKKYSTKYYDVADESASNLPDGWIGSAVVTAQTGKQIAVVVNIFFGADSLQTYNAFPDEIKGTSWAVPQFASRLTGNNFNTPVSVQNVSGSTMDTGTIQMSCVAAAGFSGTVDVSNPTPVQNSASYGFNPVTNLAITTNWQGACTVTAPGDVVTYVQLRKPGVSPDFAAHEAFRTDSTNSKVVIPLVAKRLTNGFSTAQIIMNLSSSDTAYVHLKYTRGSESSVGQAVYEMDTTILPRKNLIINTRLAGEPAGLTMPDGWQGTLVVTTTSGHSAVPLVGYVQLTNILPLAGDNYMAHNAFSVPETP
jgi:hypothetical protein